MRLPQKIRLLPPGSTSSFHLRWSDPWPHTHGSFAKQSSPSVSSSPRSLPLTTASSPDHSPLIMIIDDSATVRSILETGLQREGYAVISFTDGVAALKWLTHEAQRFPAVILLDIGLPKLDGYEMATKLKHHDQWKKSIIIMISRYNGIIDHMRGRLAGAYDYLDKPFKMTHVLAVIRRCLAEKVVQKTAQIPHQAYCCLGTSASEAICEEKR